MRGNPAPILAIAGVQQQNGADTIIGGKIHWGKDCLKMPYVDKIFTETDLITIQRQNLTTEPSKGVVWIGDTPFALKGTNRFYNRRLGLIDRARAMEAMLILERGYEQTIYPPLCWFIAFGPEDLLVLPDFVGKSILGFQTKSSLSQGHLDQFCRQESGDLQIEVVVGHSPYFPKELKPDAQSL